MTTRDDTYILKNQDTHLKATTSGYDDGQYVTIHDVDRDQLITFPVHIWRDMVAAVAAKID